MNTGWKLTVALCCAATLCPVAGAAAYFVDIGDPQASDSGPGAQARPWKHCPGMPGWRYGNKLKPGDTVYFRNTGTWACASGHAVLQVTGGVTYDGSSWGTGTHAVLKAEGNLGRSVVNFMADHPQLPTAVKGFEVDAGGTVTTGIGVNWPHAHDGSLAGAVKRIEGCVIHGVVSRAARGEWEYGIIVSNGYGGGRTVENVEILDCTAYDVGRGGINLYCANDDPKGFIRNALVRGCEVYDNGTDPKYAGSCLADKNHVIDSVIEYNYVHDPRNGIGMGVSTHAPEFTGPENVVYRHNIIANAEHAGMFIQPRNASLKIYGNIIVNSKYSGIQLYNGASGTISLEIYNNTFFQNRGTAQLFLEKTRATIAKLDVRNNLFYATRGGTALRDVAGAMTAHGNNLYYNGGGGRLVLVGDRGYAGSGMASWEPTARYGDPLLRNPTDPSKGFVGTYGLDLRPRTDGFCIAANSPARDAGADLGADHNTSINSLKRPFGRAWDIGAYEFGPPPAQIAEAGAKDGTDDAGTAARAAVPTVRIPKPDAVVMWDARLRERLAASLGAGATPSFYAAGLQQRVTVLAIDDAGNLRAKAGAVAMNVEWRRLSFKERAGLSAAVSASGDAEDHLMAAFFSTAAGDTDAARDSAARAGEFAAMLDEFFEAND